MDVHVSDHVAGRSERSPTNITHTLLFPLVLQLVARELFRLGEGSVTLRTRVLFRSAVEFPVSHQVTGRCESHVALTAEVVSFLRVLDHMPPQVTGFFETGVALFTGVRFLPCVDSYVCLEAGGGGEPVSAEFTRVRLFSCVFEHVRVEMSRLHEGRATDVA